MRCICIVCKGYRACDAIPGIDNAKNIIDAWLKLV